MAILDRISINLGLIPTHKVTIFLLLLSLSLIQTSFN